MARSVSITAANVHDIQEAHKLVREDDDFVNGDAGYIGIEQRKEIAGDEHLSKVQWRINRRKGRERKREKALYKDAARHLEYAAQPRWEERIEYLKSKVRSKAGHNFYIIKHIFGYRKTRYRGLEKNGARLYMLFALANVLRWSWRLNGRAAVPVTA
jgi:IS5 family transposase